MYPFLRLSGNVHPLLKELTQSSVHFQHEVQAGVHMARKRGMHPPEFRRQMFELVRTGRSPDEQWGEFAPSAGGDGSGDTALVGLDGLSATHPLTPWGTEDETLKGRDCASRAAGS